MFSIYVPQGRGEAAAMLRKVGAEWALDRSVTAMAIDLRGTGPDGGSGALVYFDSRVGDAAKQITKIDLSEQEWQPAAPCGELAAGRYWVGLWRDFRPGPEDLQRQELTEGLVVELLDRRHWQIPIADYLPSKLAIDRTTGEQMRKHLPEFAAFIEKTNAIFRHLISDDFQGHLAATMEVVIPQGLIYAAEALAVNYRVNIDLVDMLGVVGDFEAVKIAAVATGLEMRTATAREKKSALLAATSSDG